MSNSVTSNSIIDAVSEINDERKPFEHFTEKIRNRLKSKIEKLQQQQNLPRPAAGGGGIKIVTTLAPNTATKNNLNKMRSSTINTKK